MEIHGDAESMEAYLRTKNLTQLFPVYFYPSLT